MNGKTYPLGDWFPGRRLAESNGVRAVTTGEYRAPKAGEWYLSGAIPTAYRAYSDMNEVRAIMRLVRVRMVEVIDGPFE